MNTSVFKVNPENPDQRIIDAGGAIIRGGGLVAFPTETVYGLGASALDENAVANIFRAKGRPQDNPLIVHIADAADAARYTKSLPAQARVLFRRFWPGPLTVVLPKNAVIPGIVSAGLDTVALRMPDNRTALALISAAGVPIAAPSANISGRPSPTSAAHVTEDLGGKIDAIIDGGPCRIGLESTVVSLCGDVPVLLRPGKVTPEELMAELGELRIDGTVLNAPRPGLKPASPGMKYRHYAPRARLIAVSGGKEDARAYILEKARWQKQAGVLCFNDETGDYPGLLTIAYGDENDPVSLAGGLFSALRRMDGTGCQTVYARCPNADGVGLAVYNRIVKAAGFEIIRASQKNRAF